MSPEKNGEVIWLVNRGGHDYSSLYARGRVVNITEGTINPFNPDRLMLVIASSISLAGADDLIAISGLPILNALVLAMWLERFPEARILQWSVRQNEYVYSVIKKAALRQNLENANG